MSAINIGRLYAEALFSNSIKKLELDLWEMELNELHQIANNPEFRILINNPQFSKKKLTEVLLDIVSIQISETIKSLLSVIIQNNHLLFLSEITNQFVILKDTKNDTTKVYIESAFPLIKEELTALLKVLKKSFNMNLEARITINPELIGGVRIKIRDEILDASIKAKLLMLKDTLVFDC